MTDLCHHLLCQEFPTCLTEWERVIVDFGDTREGSGHRGQKQQDALKAELRPEATDHTEETGKKGGADAGVALALLGRMGQVLAFFLLLSATPWPPRVCTALTTAQPQS